MSHFAFKDAGFSEVDRMRARDRLIGLLADKLIAVTVRPGGNMHDAALRALKSSKPVAACHISVESSATEELIQAGAKPVTIEHAGISLDEFLGTPAEAGEQQDPSRREERQRDLGQFFTPRCVAEFMWRCVGAFRRTLGSGGKEIRAIDPAAGEGIFLEAAPASGSAFGELIGVDVDSQLRSGWSRSLSGQTHTRLHVADGLIDLPWLAVERGSFDVVIGNPPFGGRGLAILERVLAEMLPVQGDLFGASQSQPRRTSGTELTFGKKIAVEMLNHYETWRRTEALQLLRSDQKTAGPSIAESQRPIWRPRETKQAALVREGVDRRDELEARELQTLTYDGGPITSLVKKALTRLVSFPIEVLFVERFVQLAKPGGTIAVIVPDGIVANEQTRYLRSWIRNRADLLAVVALPRGTFSGVASNVDTSILFLRKKGPENGAAPKTIIMAHPGEFGKGQIERYLGDVEAGIASWTPETE